MRIKKNLYFILVLLIPAKLLAQGGDVAIIEELGVLIKIESSALKLEGKNSSILLKQYQLQRAIEEAKQVTVWVKNAEMIQRINELLQTMVCNERELSFYKSYIPKDNCFFDVKYDVIEMGLESSSDILYFVLVAGLRMTKAERINSLNDVVSILENSNKGMVSLNRLIISNINADIQKRYMKKLLGEYNGSYRYSRYTPVN